MTAPARPRVSYSRKWWRVHYGANPHAVAVYSTWDRALAFANLIARKANQQ